MCLFGMKRRLLCSSLCESIKMEKTKIFFKKVSGIDEFFRIYIIRGNIRGSDSLIKRMKIRLLI